MFTAEPGGCYHSGQELKGAIALRSNQEKSLISGTRALVQGEAQSLSLQDGANHTRADKMGIVCFATTSLFSLNAMRH